MPLHTVDGTSGHFAVPSAFLTNPAAEGELLGRPSVGTIGVHLGNGKYLEVYTLTETIGDRVEVGYGFNNLNVGDTYEDIGAAAGTRPSGDNVHLHNLTVKVQAVKQGGHGLSWMPAITVGATYKYNDSWSSLDDDLTPAGGLAGLTGIDNNDGVDFHLFATRCFLVKDRPLVTTLGLRSTEAAHIGLLGFTGDRKLNIEGAVCFMPTKTTFLAAEYKQKRNGYREIPGLVEEEDDWWVLAGGLVLSPHATIAVGYGHFGELLNHKANKSLGIAFKYEF
ncbi:MAG: DUF3034 family protein [Planctomycetota bacterium]